MKIGIVCYPTFGGSGVVATELARGLADRDHDVHILSYAPPARFDSFDARIRHHAIEVSSYPLFKYPPYDLALASRLAEVAEEAELDLVHVHYAIPHTVAALLVQQILAPRRLPVVTTLHGTDITVVGQERAYERITRYALQNSDAVTSVSEYLRQETVRVFGVEREIHVIHNFVDHNRFHPENEPRLRSCFTKGAEHVLMHVSNFRPVKRARLCVEAFAEVLQHTMATLVMVGDGPDRAGCEALARELGIRDRVRFVGSQSDIEHLLRAADLFLLPSEFESFGLAALEAMASGVPAVATRAGGLPEVIQDEHDGLLIDPRDMGSMGPRITALLGEPERLAAMKRAARETATSRFDRDQAVVAYERLYESVLAQVPGERLTRQSR